MTSALLLAPALILGGVLIASGVLKLRTPGGLDEFDRLGVPKALRREWIARLHPWGELLLGILLLVLGGVLGLLAALAAVVLLGAYLVLVARALRTAPDASCACFGTTKRITAVTVVRNAWLTALALFAAATSWTLPLLGGPLAALGVAGWGWVIALAATAVTVALIMWPEGEPDAAPQTAVEPVVQGEEEADYLRSITPALPLTLADGSSRTLRELSSRRALLVLAVSPTCGSCEQVIASRARWRELLPELDIRMLFTTSPENSTLLETEHPASLHDPDRHVAPSLGYRSTPSAVLLGADGMLAGGPVTGSKEIAEFIDDVYESLHGERPPA
ncbi:hypothetical protein DY023_01775 [Microbacterium bovistercoris]|uniref:Methylamine utilisation protein MauE domain-containing protein n=1 Tax=Microbacterium bovistercoris TaxID=2293570 RepID=A0A371NYP3_9MICO|nr:MauE/DoxX family redox-associated membrane protein [Microbacterium bovistercoris]REJ08017.1 hypothetical protein DY023_01775 [Microbacterium bovistercoris]